LDATDWDARYADRELVWSADPNRFVAEHTRDLTPGRALDVACGEGRNAIWLAEQGWQVTGIDFSGVALDKARRIAEQRGVTVDWVAADVTTHRPAEQAFDLVVLAYLQLPVGQLTDVHRAAAAAVAPNGTFLLVAHDRDNLERGVGGPGHAEVLTTVDQVVHDLDGTGLAVEVAAQVRRPVDTGDGVKHAIDTLVRAHRPA
jgi:2-polyprenyl-3-methyl-5-hydroxy-6-metoxy-1,4-benzoquinol methylase